MASLYERFAGKIDTNKSFPEHSPPEASLLLGQGVEEEATTPDPGPGPDLLRHRFQPHCEDEDVRMNLIYPPLSSISSST